MPKIILVAGYSKSEYLAKIRNMFPAGDILLACAYTRKPISESKQKYLSRFDMRFDLTNEADVAELVKSASEISAVTCTQERDMDTYIRTLLMLGKISDEQAGLYASLINKLDFKEIVSKENPELVPQVAIVNDALLENLESLTYPQVVKPSGLTGSILVRVVNNPEEMREHIQNFAELSKSIAGEYFENDVNFITEEFITGPQYSVNVYINNEGRVTFCPVIRVITPQEVGVNDTYSLFQYTSDELTESEYKSLTDSIQKLVNLFKVKSTSAHFDVVNNNGQWKFFEAGLRIGGNRQRIFEMSHGMDHFVNDVKNRLDQTIVIPETKKTVCVVQTASEEKGVLKSIHYTRDVHSSDTKTLIVEDKLAKIGTDIMPVSQGGGTITRHFVVGKDIQDVLETSRALYDSMEFKTE